MHWSIYKDDADFDKPVDEWEEDLTTDAPDGTYDVRFTYLRGRVGIGHGLVVKDGKFVKETALAAAETARDEVEYWGDFVEELQFVAEENLFEVEIGS